MKLYYQHYRDDPQELPKTLAIAVNGDLVAVGAAYTAENDNFCRRVGRSIAEQRARQALDRKKTYHVKGVDVLSKQDGNRVLGVCWPLLGAESKHPKDLFIDAEAVLDSLERLDRGSAA